MDDAYDSDTTDDTGSVVSLRDVPVHPSTAIEKSEESRRDAVEEPAKARLNGWTEEARHAVALNEALRKQMQGGEGRQREADERRQSVLMLLRFSS